MSALEFFQFLTPGSVWVRPDTKRRVKFLFLTNEKLSAKLQLKNPSQVVYVDENGDVFNRSIDAFREQYQFNHVDGDLEKRIQGLFTFDVEDILSVEDGDAEDDEEVDVEDADDADEMPNVIEAAAEDTRHPIEIAASTTDVEVEEIEEAPLSKRTLAEAMAHDLMAEPAEQPAFAVGFMLSGDPELDEPALTVAQLSDAIVRYSSEASMVNEGSLMHRLTFRLDGNVTIEALTEIFHPESRARTVDAFNVSTPHGNETFVYEGYLGVFPEYALDGLNATVVVSTPSEDTPPVTAETPPETFPIDFEPFINVEAPLQEMQTSAPLPDVSALAELVKNVQAVDPQAVVPDPVQVPEVEITLYPANTSEVVTAAQADALEVKVSYEPETPIVDVSAAPTPTPAAEAPAPISVPPQTTVQPVIITPIVLPV